MVYDDLRNTENAEAKIGNLKEDMVTPSNERKLHEREMEKYVINLKRNNIIEIISFTSAQVIEVYYFEL